MSEKTIYVSADKRGLAYWKDLWRYRELFYFLACRVPVIVAATGAMKEILNAEPGNIFVPGGVDRVLTALRFQAERPHALSMNVPTWTMMGKRLKSFFRIVWNQFSVIFWPQTPFDGSDFDYKNKSI